LIPLERKDPLNPHTITMSSRIASCDALPPEVVRQLATPFTALEAPSMRNSVTTDFRAVNRCAVSSSAVLFAT